MLMPDVPSGMKEPHHLAGRRIDASDVWSLVPIAPGTSQRKIALFGGAAMFGCHDVIDMLCGFHTGGRPASRPPE